MTTTPHPEDMPACGDCGMPCKPGEYHPYAACLMFKACHNSDTVRANLEAVAEQRTRAMREAKVKMTEAEFIEWFGKNYYGEVVFGDPSWHAKSIYRRLVREVQQ